MSWDTTLQYYLGTGLASALPASGNPAPNTTEFFYAYDTPVLHVWNTNTSAWDTIAGGTVTSVGLTLPAIFLVSGSPVTGSGTIAATLATQTANYVWAGPASGVAATPAFRALVPADLPVATTSALGAVQPDGTTITISAGVISAVTGGGGTVTSVSVVSANGFAGTVATATTTPAITLSTTITGILKGNGTAISAATAGTDYVSPSDANVFTNQQAITPYRANISGAVSIDLSATAKSNNLHLTLTGNVTSFALTNPVDGAVYNIRFIQDATGSRTFAGFPSAFKFAGGTAPTFSTAANAVDFMSAEYGSTEATYMASFLKGMA